MITFTIEIELHENNAVEVDEMHVNFTGPAYLMNDNVKDFPKPIAQAIANCLTCIEHFKMQAKSLELGLIISVNDKIILTELKA